MKKLKVLSIVAAGVMALSVAALPAFAVEVEKEHSVPVKLTAEASTFKVTVPTSIALHVAADGTVTGGDFDITNQSSGPVVVTSVTATDAEWSIESWANMKDASYRYPAGSDTLALSFTNTPYDMSSQAFTAYTDENGALSVSEMSLYVLQKLGSTEYEGNSLTLQYNALTSPVLTAQNDVAAANVVFVFDWYNGTNGDICNPNKT